MAVIAAGECIHDVAADSYQCGVSAMKGKWYGRDLETDADLRCVPVAIIVLRMHRRSSDPDARGDDAGEHGDDKRRAAGALTASWVISLHVTMVPVEAGRSL